MSTLNALDYAWGRPDLGVLYANGIRLVCRYLSHDTGKNLSAGEATEIHAAGLGVLLNWESDAGRPLLGASAGAEDGRDAAALAEQVGAPHGLTIIYSCDRDINSSQYPQIDAYYAAAKQATAGRYGVGVYGEADLIDHLAVDAYWQTIAWSGGRLSNKADLYQFAINQSMGGASVDYNQIIDAAQLGAWWPAGHPLSGGGTLIPASPTEDDDMKAIISTNWGGDWAVSPDLTSRVHIITPQDSAALIAAGTHVRAPLTDAQMTVIPDVTLKA